MFVMAGAAGGVGQLTVSNAAPVPGSAIAVTSTGWIPGHAVTIAFGIRNVEQTEEACLEMRRVLRPGGRFSFAEHVAARPRTPTRWSQRILRRPWAWVFEGCSCERDLASLISTAGFTSVDINPYRIHSPFVPFNTHIAGTAIA